MTEAMVIKTQKVLLHILNSLQKLDCIPYKTFFKVFDSKVTSVLLYGSELWGLEKCTYLESVQIYACKRFLKVPQRACNDAILGDTGRLPMYIFAAKRCMKYWLRLLKTPRNRYIRLCYEMLKYYDSVGHTNWVSKVRTTALDMYGIIKTLKTILSLFQNIFKE